MLRDNSVPPDVSLGREAMKSWFSIDGSLPDIDYPGDTTSRYPEELVELMVAWYSEEGDWVLDPFCGFGTTIDVCARMNRNAVGFEKEESLYRYAQSRVAAPSAVHHDRAENIERYRYPQFNLLLTSPPFRSFHDHSAIDNDNYYRELVSVFTAFRPALAPGAHVVVESVNLLADSGDTIPRAFSSALALASLFHFEREHVCCNTGGVEVAPGYHHSYLLVFRNGP